jgi:hypothetical protein
MLADGKMVLHFPIDLERRGKLRKRNKLTQQKIEKL